ncbi:MAG: GyrI-like domain-containing protein [Dokdonia sp.]|nr:GyrI-like domain-containing protein [Dokdonia sp.]
MENTKKEAFAVVGIKVRTSNAPGHADQQIPALWSRFMEEGIAHKLPNKVDETIYAVYTDYEGDHTGPYTTLIGYRVDNLDHIDESLSVKMIPASTYAQFTAKGNLVGGAVIDTWMEIWKTKLQRTYTADLEVYGEKAIDPSNGEAHIFVAIE